MTQRQLFLVSNDDGVHAPGIKALAEAVAPLGDVVVVAPSVERSGMGQALSLTLPLRIDKVAANIWAVDGTPTDCVIMALHKVLHRRPDWVVSGINRGCNIGQDTLYSGTVAAAMEGCVHGIPSVAFSLNDYRALDHKAYADAVQVVRMLFEHKELLAPAYRGVLNVNIPAVPLSEMKGFKVTRLGRRIYEQSLAEGVDPRGRPYYWIGGGGEQFVDIPDSDCPALFDGYVTLTVLRPEHTDPEANEALRTSLVAELNAKLK